MGSPTDEYLQRSELLHKALGKVNLDNLETRIEPLSIDGEMVLAPSGCLGFYQGNKKVGELYFTEDPIRLVELESSFKQYADELRKKLGI
ncbi:MAG TPA: hypothetical protein VJA18_02215 [Candidatus Nanoarchaeia archaeon]|nr:hypothetical protein [Candidatus Nanoarchaeia archaeon]